MFLATISSLRQCSRCSPMPWEPAASGMFFNRRTSIEGIEEFIEAVEVARYERSYIVQGPRSKFLSSRSRSATRISS